MGRGNIDLKNQLSKIEQSDQPAVIMMIFITDGKENSGKEFTKQQVQKMISEKQGQEKLAIRVGNTLDTLPC